MTLKSELRIFREKIREYTREEPNRFLQIDGRPIEINSQRNTAYLSNVIEVENDLVIFSETVELMNSSAVRVLIRPETSHHDAVRILRNVLNAFEKRPETLMKLLLRAEIENEISQF